MNHQTKAMKRKLSTSLKVRRQNRQVKIHRTRGKEMIQYTNMDEQVSREVSKKIERKNEIRKGSRRNVEIYTYGHF